MLVLMGKGVSPGIAMGKAYVLERDHPEVPEYVLPKHLIEDEVRRFRIAVEASRRQLKEIRSHIPPSAPAETASFIDTHILILEDTMISQAPLETIQARQYNAEWALKLQSDELIEVFERMEDPYLRNRKTDVVQVVDRVLRNLLKPGEEEHAKLQSDLTGYIIVANDLTPADTVILKYKHIGAFVTNVGGPISHTAIIARSLGIPAIVAVHGATQYIRNDEELIVDGKRGALIAAPEPAIVAEYRARQKDIQRVRKELETLKVAPAVTRDGVEVALMANIELPDDVKAVQQAAAMGIGLYRTEFLFMNREGPPDENEQFAAYLKVVRALGTRKIVIRTLDLGADKTLQGARDHSVNPALGLRAVRLCLRETDLFRAQLRAILRVSAHGRVGIMIPMLSNLDEALRVREIIEETKQALDRERVSFNPSIPIGAMIEVPAAAIAADLFAQHFDFLSIGTNDLIQYTLAIDRVDDAVNYLYDPLHPSVLRLIATTIDAGRAAKIPVAMCGEMAGDARYTRLLLGMGLRDFSMHPSALLEIKKIVRESDLSELAALAKDVMRVADHGALHRLVDAHNEKAAHSAALVH